MKFSLKAKADTGLFFNTLQHAAEQAITYFAPGGWLCCAINK